MVIGSDHAGFLVKSEIIPWLKEDLPNYEVVDHGTNNEESVHYPDYALKVCQDIIKYHDAKGILICGSGIGMSIMANRFKGIRAALCRTTYDGRICWEHNMANIICLGSRTNTIDELKEIIKAWLSAKFAEGRHNERIERLDRWGSLLTTS